MPEQLCRRVACLPAAQPLEFAGLAVHLIGIGGCGMSGAASVLARRGAVVSGSDQSSSETLEDLAAAGITVHVGHDHRHVPERIDLVVASAAVGNDNPELLAAQARGVRTLKYAQLLGEIMRCSTGVAIAGTHGKSTTTALSAFIATRLGLDPSFIVGATVPQLGGGSGVGSGDIFIVEACEYDRSFLNLAPTHAAILNIEEDHLDYFEDLEDIIQAFREFADLVPEHGVVVFNQEDAGAIEAVAGVRCAAESIGLCEGATWRAAQLTYHEGLPHFELWHGDRCVGRTSLGIPGRHNVYNALAACAILHRTGAPVEDVLAVLPEFSGAHRRLTYRGRFRGIDIVDDYAHHPTEIRVTLQAIRQRYRPARLRVVFQPHQVSRTRLFLEDFADSFSLADEVIVPEIYFVRDSEADRLRVCSDDLVQRIRRRGGQANYIPELGAIAEHLACQAQEGDLVVTMGAGDVWKVADELVRRLGSDR